MLHVMLVIGVVNYTLEIAFIVTHLKVKAEKVGFRTHYLSFCLVLNGKQRYLKATIPPPSNVQAGGWDER
jgi:hypothetical protein